MPELLSVYRCPECHYLSLDEHDTCCAMSDGEPISLVPVRAFREEDVTARVVAALWDTFPLGCTEYELREVVATAFTATHTSTEEA